MVNLMSVDAQRLMDLTTYANVLWSSPLVILISLYFLYDAMGPSTLAGVGVLVLLIPVNLVVSRIARKLQVSKLVVVRVLPCILALIVYQHTPVHVVGSCPLNELPRYSLYVSVKS